MFSDLGYRLVVGHSYIILRPAARRRMATIMPKARCCVPMRASGGRSSRSTRSRDVRRRRPCAYSRSQDPAFLKIVRSVVAEAPAPGLAEPPDEHSHE